jgi:hypothetical protein
MRSRQREGRKSYKRLLTTSSYYHQHQHLLTLPSPSRQRSPRTTQPHQQTCTPYPSSSPLQPQPSCLPAKSPPSHLLIAMREVDVLEPYASVSLFPHPPTYPADTKQNKIGLGDLYPGCNVISDLCTASLKLNYAGAGCKGTQYHLLSLLSNLSHELSRVPRECMADDD